MPTEILYTERHHAKAKKMGLLLADGDVPFIDESFWPVGEEVEVTYYSNRRRDKRILRGVVSETGGRGMRVDFPNESRIILGFGMIRGTIVVRKLRDFKVIEGGRFSDLKSGN
jgi:hypothetical protein